MQVAKRDNHSGAQQEFAPSFKLSTGEDGAMFRTWFQGKALAQVDSGEHDKKKVYRKGRPSFYGTRNRNRTCN